MYSFLGGLWFAGLSGVDTLASMAASSGSSTLRDFYGRRRIERHVDSLRGHQRFTCVYYDTAIASYRLGAWDRAPGIEVRQTSHAFASPPYDRFILIDYLIRNRSGQTIRRPYVGFFDDADIANTRAGHLREDGPKDDIAGFIPSHTIAYALDNDGDPHGDTVWVPTSSVGAMGIAPVFADPLPHDTSFNWWATDFGQLTWAPMRPSPDYPSYNSSLPYFPGGPRQVYWTMANHEKDYDQLWSAVDMSGEGWRKPRLGPAAENLANGLDTRILLSFGFPDMEPGDSIRIVIAVAAGDSVHVHPADFARLFDPQHPGNLNSQFDFSDLIRNVEMARAAWAGQFDLYAAAPAFISTAPDAGDAVRCEWTPAPFYHVRGYRLFARPLGEASWQCVAESDQNRRASTASGLQVGRAYEFAVASLDWNLTQGPLSHPDTIIVGRPVTVPELTCESVRNVVAVRISVTPPPAPLPPLRFVNLYRKSEYEDDFHLLARIALSATDGATAAGQPRRGHLSLLPNAYIDGDIAIGTRYSYRASVENSLGLEGPPSPAVSVTAMTKDRRGLIIFLDKQETASLYNPERQLEFYGNWAAQMGFDTSTIVDDDLQRWDSLVSIQYLARYQCIVLVDEDPRSRSPLRTVFMPFYGIRKYLASGGRAVFATRNHGNYFWYCGCYSPAFIVREFCGVDAVFYEKSVRGTQWLRGEFLGAQSVDARYESVEADSTAGWDMPYLRQLADQVDTIFAAGYIPYIGALGSLDEHTQVLYTYESAYEPSNLHGKPVAVERITDSTATVMFNFPLSLMKREQAWRALTQAIVDLGIDTTNYWTPPATTNRAMIEWLYGKSSTRPDPDWDINRDGVIDIRDVVGGIKR
ncbi:MAG TPA: fibronectin type III domain-containing protein [bacterium]|nr:fibronectin type III domain-containing protein [bacterium]